MFCRQQVAQLRDAQPQIEARGAKLIVIGNGAVNFVEGFREELRFEGPIYVDPSLRTYKALEFRRSAAGAVNLKSAKAAAKALKQGYRQSATRGDGLQLGGVLVVDTNGDIRFVHRSDYAGDHPQVEDIIAALPPSEA